MIGTQRERERERERQRERERERVRERERESGDRTEKLIHCQKILMLLPFKNNNAYFILQRALKEIKLQHNSCLWIT